MLVKVIMELIYILYVCDGILTIQKHFKAVIRVKLIYDFAVSKDTQNSWVVCHNGDVCHVWRKVRRISISISGVKGLK